MKWIIVAAVVVLLIVLVLNYSGFSYARMKWLSDTDFENMAIKEIVKYDRSGQFDSVETFRERFPKCCKVLRFDDGAGGNRNLLPPLFGDYKPYVVIWYDRIEGSRPVPYEAWYFVNKRGEASFERGIEVYQGPN